MVYLLLMQKSASATSQQAVTSQEDGLVRRASGDEARRMSNLVDGEVINVR